MALPYPTKSRTWNTSTPNSGDYFDDEFDQIYADIAYVDGLSRQIYPPGHVHGLTISNNNSDPTDDIDIAAGSARDATDSENIRLATGLTKQLNAAWTVGTNQGMLDTGTVGDNTYHLWLIKRSDTGVVDVLASLSASSPTMPANYDYKAYMWPIVRSGGSNVAFTQNGRRFDLTVPVLYSTGADPGTSRITATLSSIPAGIVLTAVLQAGLNGNTVNTIMTLRPLTEADAAPSLSAAPFFDVQSYNIGSLVCSNEMQVRTNTSAQVAIRLSHSGGGQIGYALQKGWIVP